MEEKLEIKRENLFKPPVRVFLVLAFALSWPFLTYGFGWFRSDEDILTRYILSCSAMLMVALSAFIVRTSIERKGFRDVGWNLSNYRWYLSILALCLLFWLVPLLVASLVEQQDWNFNLSRDALLVVVLSVAGASVIAGLGEEFGWRGYLLPRLLSDRRRIRRILLIIGLIWGVWHLPLAFGPLLKAALEGSSDLASMLGPALWSCIQAVAASIILSFIFGAVWLKTKSIFLVAFLHGYYIGIRDSGYIMLGDDSAISFPVHVVMLLVIWIIAFRWLAEYERNREFP